MSPLRPLALSLVVLTITSVPAGALVPRETVASSAEPYRFHLLSWETRVLLAQGTAAIRQQLTHTASPSPADIDLVKHYFTLSERRSGRLADLARAGSNGPEASAIEAELAALEKDAERVIAGQLAQALREEDLERGPAGLVLFPPVLFELQRLPTLLVISPRDRIELQESHLLRQDVAAAQREHIEGLGTELGLSAIVTDIGGLATYPSFVPSEFGLQFALSTAAHEWLHQYLAFQPLGKAYATNGEMTSLNETVASLFGDELGARLYHELYGGPPPPPIDREPGAATPRDPSAFDFTREMRQTRLHTEDLLRAGDVAQAEAYMEERRQLFLAHGYYLRKLNQAYFAFNGSYAEGPASVSPLGRQIRIIRVRSTGLADFVHRMERFGRIEDFQAYVKAAGLNTISATAP